MAVGREKMSDIEMVATITKYLEAYKAALNDGRKPFDENEWQGLELRQQYKRINDWIRREKNKAQKTANGLFNELQDINNMSAVDLLDLKSRVCALIDKVAKEKRDNEIAAIEKKLSKFDEETKLAVMRAKEDVESRRLAEKRRLKEQLKTLQG